MSECVACEHPLSIPEEMQGTVVELHSCGGSEESLHRVWSTEWETCIVWGTHDPEAARAAWAGQIDPDEDQMPDWKNASQEWADPAELEKDEDQPWTLTGPTQLHPHWVPFLAWS
ncbi:hypothetical protein ASF72_10740 [Arthrobacter sp. Leaf141]|uniref:hypothetical protein n=1 Tax=Arthrobacter sp. Leaf141 TaxID=1736273 RepID=UPI0007001EFC|nr:hypothetical protein [Arthrobacter sp. Leaf141]KQR02502.1 hypothetical protein ASF72_10740 [Arthrobacter sp. Leaf141]